MEGRRIGTALFSAFGIVSVVAKKHKIWYDIERVNERIMKGRRFMRKGFGVAVLSVAILVTGCSSGPDLSRFNNDLEAEYIAGTLLKYNADYEGMLEYDRSILDVTPTPVPTPTLSPTATPESENETETGSGEEGEEVQQIAVALDDISPVAGIAWTKETYEVKQSYGSNFASVEAGDGNQLLIVKFRLKNTNTKKKHVSFVGAKVSYVLEVDGQPVATPLQTIIERDMQYFDDTIPAGKSREGVLIFKISKKQKIENATIKVIKENQAASIELN